MQFKELSQFDQSWEVAAYLAKTQLQAVLSYQDRRRALAKDKFANDQDVSSDELQDIYDQDAW